MGRNEIAAVGITALIAYHDGFEFTLTIVFADPQNRLTPLRSMHRVRLAQVRGDPPPSDDEQFSLALTFGDGSSVTSSGEFGFAEETPAGKSNAPPPSLTHLDGSGGGVVSKLRWFVTPLPPPGPIVFSCEWPPARVSFRHQLDAAGEIQAAAERSTFLLSSPES